MPTTKHILFGNAMRGSGGGAAYTNPYAELVKGYKDYGRSTLDIQLELKQDFDFLVKGLKARVLFNTSRYSYFEVSRNYNPYYYNVSSYDKTTGDYTLMLLNGNDNPTEYLNYNEGGKDINYRTYIEAAMEYNRTFGKHSLSGLLVYQNSNQVKANQGDLQKSLPYRNQGLSAASPTDSTAATSRSSTSDTTVRSASTARNATASSRPWVWHGWSPTNPSGDA